jgi:hypothetical protein
MDLGEAGWEVNNLFYQNRGNKKGIKTENKKN